MNIKVFVPQDSTALSLGADQIARDISRHIDQHNLNVELIRNGSRGLFWLETMIEVSNSNGRVAYGPVSPEDVPSLLASGLLDASPDHALFLGDPELIPYLKNQQRLTFARAGLADPVDIMAYKNKGGFSGVEKALQLTSQQIVDEVKTSGLRGRGGAAFPTGIKWQTVLDATPIDNSKQKYIICNADEGDSGTFADRLLLESDPFTLIEGMCIAGLATEATKGFIYVRSEYQQAQEKLESAIEIATQHGLLGNNILQSGRHFHLEIRRGAGAYICGEETALIESLEGKRGLVRVKPPLPALEGLFQRPTAVNNVLTLAAIPYILSQGARAYAKFGAGKSQGTQPFQLAGNIKQGGLIELAFGITLKQLIDQYGGGSLSGKAIKVLQVGGPLGTYLASDQWDIPLEYEAMSEQGAVLGHGGIVAFDSEVKMIEQATFGMEFCVQESCGKCTPCRIGSQRGKDLLVDISDSQNVQQNIELLEDLCDTMAVGSLCAMGGMTPNPVLSALKIHQHDSLNQASNTHSENGDF